MNEDLTIDGNNRLRPAEDYDFLRREGIRLIERLSGKVWTDYNAHDPGITLLEALCYTLTDLAYRTGYNINDLLAKKEQSQTHFATARQVLPTNPVTIMDLRKLIIDTDGVKNAWVEKSSESEVFVYAVPGADGGAKRSYALSFEPRESNQPIRFEGLYKILVEYTDDTIDQTRQEAVNTVIRKKLQIHRNLCEDFLTIRPMEFETFKMEAEIQVREGSDIEMINARILHVISDFFSPSVNFYTLDQMIEKRYSGEEIFDGPALKNGFIATAELERSERYMDIHLSDIINLISDIPDVIAVKKCQFPSQTQSAFSDFTQWITSIREDEMLPKLDVEKSIIHFVRSGDRHRSPDQRLADAGMVKALYSFLRSEHNLKKNWTSSRDILEPAGEDMEVAEYYPFQFTLPDSYGLHDPVSYPNADGRLPPSESDGKKERQAKQILQLRGYLLVFEQIMSDYFGQLASIGNLFSAEPDVLHSFSPQPLTAVPDMDLLILNHKMYDANLLALNESREQFLSRRTAMLKHLLARFGEDAGAYFLTSDKLTSGTRQNRIDIHSQVLAKYPETAGYRGAARDCADADKVFSSGNVPGFKKRIALLLGLTTPDSIFFTSGALAVEPVDLPGQIARQKVVIRNEKSPDEVLLQTDNLENVGDAADAIRSILQQGIDRRQYTVDRQPDKLAYRLKSKDQENDLDVIAAQAVKSEEDLELKLGRLIDLLTGMSTAEGFHVLEHILLRPKAFPHDASKTATAQQKKMTPELLAVTEVPPDIAKAEPVQSTEPVFNYRIANLRNASGDVPAWQLEVVRGIDALILCPDTFVSQSRVRKRIRHMRRAGTDDDNYKRIKFTDDRKKFTITQLGVELAASSKSYEDAETMEKDIAQLIRFFSFEIDHNDTDEDSEPGLNEIVDPYSFRVSIFFPTWPAKFRDPNFRHLLEKAIYLETPSHILADVYWLDYLDMQAFEAVYRPWLKEMTRSEIPDIEVVNALIRHINTLRLDIKP